MSQKKKKKQLSQVKKKRIRRETAWGYLFIGPGLILMFGFVLLPLAYAFFISFEKWSPFIKGTWVGLQNYTDVIKNGLFKKALLNNIGYAFWTITIGFLLEFTIAVLIRNLPNRRMRNLVRAVVFFPTVCSTVMMGMLWSYLLQPQIGMFNSVLRAIGISDPPSWLSNSTTAPIVLYGVAIWFYTGYWVIIFLTRMLEIPDELYEAARIDGAGFWTISRRITLPLCKPTIYLYLSTTLITCWAQFDLAYVLSNVTGISSSAAGPGNSLLLPTFLIYRTAFNSMDFGGASAMGMTLLAFIALVSFINTKLSKYWVSYD